ncbi:MAG: hypothetical protein KGO02_00205 [Alphaproteobacteria bacterium]|nr:hypothetical protein [Alphaproteobacteria bacterium]
MQTFSKQSLIIETSEADHSEVAAVLSDWRPKWLIEIDGDTSLGLTIDDGCFIVLYPKGDDTWRPGTHIPKRVAESIAQHIADSRLHD